MEKLFKLSKKMRFWSHNASGKGLNAPSCFNLYQPHQRCLQQTVPAESEGRSYFDSPRQPISSNPLIYWNNKDKYKRLCVIAQNVLALPASSAPVERLFSIAGKVFRPERCRLAHNRFSHMMFIRCNNRMI